MKNMTAFGEVSDITNINTYSPSFEFLKTEPDLYSVSDLI